mgnify:CR=1 FL=1
MKKFFVTAIFLLCTIVQLKATLFEQDSLYSFLKHIGEDSAVIPLIVSSPEAQDPNTIINNYLSLIRLRYEPSSQQYEWYPGWEDSLYACKYAQYISQKIIQDTATYLINHYLENAYVFLYTYEYATLILLNSAEYAIERFHSRSGYLIPYLYYNKKETSDWQEKLRFYEMTEFVVSSSEKMLNFDKDTNKKINAILAEPDDLSPEYTRFRNLLNGYSDMDLVRISIEQKEELVHILLQGIANGEKKAQLTYAFMLLTGQFVETNEKLGKQLLSLL